ncbi:hypothetical protein E3E14_18640 [Streptomyces sp. ICN441]|uniref:twin-arginine translocase TatA/TatE family subunit n=1 Tax=Streptomyces sp. ICN441 TaxID=2558286 RepID=UPI00106A1D90|nr:twin-arginine translocase TatA/TatE family subunit [Streptomyces sp. ICN441]TFE48112.1 hypothetical protein E3E14_18640 [Streptomyces sp. ICN441]
MFADVSPLKLIVLAALGFLLFGPEKLPGAVRNGLALLRAVREFSGSTQERIRSEWGPEFADFEFRDMDPRTLLRRHLQSGDPLGLDEIRTALDPRTDMAHAAAATREAAGGAAARPAAHDHPLGRDRPAGSLARDRPAGPPVRDRAAGAPASPPQPSPFDSEAT